jgi:hypothetical protein
MAVSARKCDGKANVPPDEQLLSQTWAFYLQRAGAATWQQLFKPINPFALTSEEQEPP